MRRILYYYCVFYLTTISSFSFSVSAFSFPFQFSVSSVSTCPTSSGNSLLPVPTAESGSMSKYQLKVCNSVAQFALFMFF